jgi:non-ribosomal peptide synthetase component F
VLVVYLEPSQEMQLLGCRAFSKPVGRTPLDPASPKERLASMLEDTQTQAALLTQAHMVESLP